MAAQNSKTALINLGEQGASAIDEAIVGARKC
jgi:hypothetical protein